MPVTAAQHNADAAAKEVERRRAARWPTLAAAGLMLLKKRKADLAQASPASVLPAVVAVMELNARPVALTLPAMGIVASDISAVLSTRISGQVMEVLKKEGDAVQKGEVLVRIDATDLAAKKQGIMLQRQGIAFQVEAKHAEVKALKAARENAREAHARTKELLDVKAASVEQYQAEETGIAEIKAKIKAARKSMETLQKSMETLGASMREIDSLMNYATLVAPIDGTVSQILTSPGDLATPANLCSGSHPKPGFTCPCPCRVRFPPLKLRCKATPCP